MGGKWTFQFKYGNRHTLDLQKYQTFLTTIRDEFTSPFADMNPNEGEVKWTTPTGNANSGNAEAESETLYNNNIFARFSYNCTRPHANKGAGHGSWTIYWNPKLTKTQNKIHARCAPALFKDLSNQIQEKLAEEFPQHFSVDLENGISGYEAGASNLQSAVDSVIQAAIALSVLDAMESNDVSDSDDDDHLAVVQEFDLSNDRCPHWYPWGYCPEECGLDLVDNDYYY